MPFTFQLPWARESTPTIAGHKIELPKTDLKAAAGDVKRSVTEGADQIASVAADVSRDAAKLGRDAAKKAGALAVTGETALRTLGADAKSTVDDLRSYRLVRQAGPDVRPGLALLAGIGAGVAAMFFLDPEHGHGRRVRLMDQLNKWARVSGDWLNGTARDLRNRSVGLAHEARKAVESAGDKISESADDIDRGIAAGTPDVAFDLEATDQVPTNEYQERTYAGEPSH